MIDGVKIQAYGTTRTAWTENPNLSFEGRFSVQSGEVLTDRTVSAHSRGVNFRIPGQSAPYLEGSLHRFANGGKGNGNDFSHRRLVRTISELERHYNIVPYVAELTQLEFGVNVHLPFDAKTLVGNLISTPRPGANKGFVQMNAQKLNLGKVAKFSDYQIKIYDKGAQQATQPAKAEKRLLRIEIKAIRKRYINERLGIRFLSDLEKPDVMARLGDYLAEMIDGLIIYGGILARKKLTTEERLREKDYANPIFWEQQTPTAREKHRKRFFDLLEKHNTTPQNGMLRALVSKKWKELTGNDLLRFGTDTPTRETQVLNECKQCGTDISHKRKNARYCSDKCRKSAKRGVAPTRPEKLVLVRVCEVCGKDISSLKSNAKYCSTTCRVKRNRLKHKSDTTVTGTDKQRFTKPKKPPPKRNKSDTTVTKPPQEASNKLISKKSSFSKKTNKSDKRNELKKKRSERPRDG